MFTFTQKPLNLMLSFVAICLSASFAAHANETVLVSTFQSSTTPETYGAGSDVGQPDSLHVAGGLVTVVGDPCVTAGGSGQCLELTLNSQLDSNQLFGPGRYEVTLGMAGGSDTKDVSVFLDPLNYTLFPVYAHSAFTTYRMFTAVANNNLIPLQIEVADNTDILLQYVSVERLSAGAVSAAPEPNTARLLLLVGAGVLAFAARHNLKKRCNPVGSTVTLR